LFSDIDFNMSVPRDRDIITISLNPKAASQALNVRITTLNTGAEELRRSIDMEAIIINLKVILSKDKRTIKKCDC
jgi:hypothetical protein